MSSVLSYTVMDIKKRFGTFAPSDASFAKNVLTGITKRKTFEILTKLEKENQIERNLSWYIKYQGQPLDVLRGILESSQKDSLVLFELLTVMHLFNASAGLERLYDFEKYFRVRVGSVIEIPKPEVSDEQFMLNVIDSIRTEKRTISNVDFAETLVIPAGPYKGRLYRHDRAPYNRQIHKWMSPEDPCRELTNMWAVQVGKSTALENTAIYYSKIVPSEIMVALATGGAAEKFSKKRYTPRAAGAGVLFIADNFGDMKKRDSGNRILSKEFTGGNIDFVTVGSTSQTASETKRVCLKDELDRWPMDVGSEGDPDQAIDARADTWGDRAKIMNVSSPNLLHTSKIYKKFLRGTQHHYHVECPICKNKYPLEMFNGTVGSSGLNYETKAGKLDPSMIYYLCPHCHDAWYDNDKMFAMQQGLWVPHATPELPNIISTQLSSLYSPFKNWEKICSQHLDQLNDPDKEQEFTNMVLGLPYEEKGIRPEAGKLEVLKDDSYKLRDVPEGVLYLTCSIDVQRGSKGDLKEKNPPRLEVQVLGHGDTFTSMVVDYFQILGETDSINSGAWKKLGLMFDDGTFDYYRKRDEFLFNPMIFLIDARDGSRKEIVFRQIMEWGRDRVYPSMGESYIHRGIKEYDDNEDKEDKSSTKNYHRYKKRRDESGLDVYHISTAHYKTHIYNNIERSLSRAGESGEFWGKMRFPRDITDKPWKYFDMLTAEEKKPDGSFYTPSGRRNEALDTFVYCLAGADIWMGMYIDSLKKMAKAKSKNPSQANVDYIDYLFCRDLLRRKTKQIEAETEEIQK